MIFFIYQNPYSEKGSTKLLNTDPICIWIGIHNNRENFLKPSKKIIWYFPFYGSGSTLRLMQIKDTGTHYDVSGFTTLL